MGQWTITVEGTGCHHNPANPQDADKMALQFVDELQNAGHFIEHASFIAGRRQEIQPLLLDAGVPTESLDC
jgi:hypothetical protein